MDTTIRKVSIRNRVIAVLLAALLVLGVGFMVAPPTNAYATTPTGNEHVWNPETPSGTPFCPVGGLFTFEGTGFVPNSFVTIYLTTIGQTLGTFDIDANGNIEPNGVYTDDRCTVIIPLNAPVQETTLLFFYDGVGPETATSINIDITATPYEADYSDTYWDNDELKIDIDNADYDSWGEEREIWIKIDYAEEPLEQTIMTDVDGKFDVTVDLPDLVPGSTHVITLLSPPVSSDFPAISVSHTFTVSDL
jgi:hypothetical protein